MILNINTIKSCGNNQIFKDYKCEDCPTGTRILLMVVFVKKETINIFQIILMHLVKHVQMIGLVQEVLIKNVIYLTLNLL